MAIRYVSFTVSEDTVVSPTTPQYGGVQGEHHATELAFIIEVNGTLANPNYQYYIECVDAAGGYDRTDRLYRHGGEIKTLIPLAWTQYGGISTVRLIIEEEGVILYSLEGRLQFEDRGGAIEQVDGLLRTDLRQTLDACRATLDEANAAVDEARQQAAAVTDELRDEVAAVQQDTLAVQQALDAWPLEVSGSNPTAVQMKDTDRANDVAGQRSVALGGGNRIGATSNYSLAVGCENGISNAGKQTALGLRNLADGNIAQVIGRYNTVSGITAIGIGERNAVAQDNAVALGYGLTTAVERQVVLGRLNAPNESAVLIVGNGSTDRSNAMTVQADGSITVGGHFEDAVIRPALRGTDRFSAYAVGEDIAAAGNVTVSDVITWSGRKTALFTGFNGGAAETAPQTDIEDCYVRAGEPYTLTLRVYSSYSNAAAVVRCDVLVASPEQQGAPFADSAAYTAALATTQQRAFTNDRFEQMTFTFTPAVSGVVRLCLHGTVPSGNKYYVGGVLLNNDSPRALPYRYASASDNRHELLYRCGDVPCDGEHIADWLLGRTLMTEYGDITVTADMLSCDLADWHDAGYNYIVKHNDVILLCVCNTILPTKMDAKALGLYASVRVSGIPYRRWVDMPVDVTGLSDAVGNIETALDGILAIQNELIGGDAV